VGERERKRAKESERRGGRECVLGGRERREEEKCIMRTRM